MRLIRLEITNFGGVKHAEVNFRVEGVTVVEGPNEAGKTTLRDAFARLLDTKANSTNHKKIGRYFPVHSDVGPSVTAEFTTGPYHLIYSKQWKTGKRTELNIVVPASESITGDPAHDRVEEILKETLDEGLWNVLQHAQGTSWDEFTPVKSTAFLGALDAASGGERFSRDGSSESLWERVEEERERYFTGTGRPRGDLVTAVSDLDNANERLAVVDAELSSVEADAQMHAELSHRVLALGDESKEAQAARVAADAAWGEIAGLRTQKVEMEYKAAAASSKMEVAQSSVNQRKKLAEQASDAKEVRLGLEVSEESVKEKLTSATSLAESARKTHAEAVEELREAQRTENGAAALLTLIEEWHSLADRKSRRDIAKRELDRMAKSESTLESNAVDDVALERITSADAARREAGTRLDAAKLSIRLEASSDVRVTSPAGESALTRGEEVEFDVAAGDEVVIGDAARLEVLGTDVQRDLVRELQGAQEQLESLAKDFDLDGDDILRNAIEKNRERDRAEQTLDNSRTALEAALRDLTYEELVGKIERQEKRFAEHSENAKAQDLDDNAAAVKAKEDAARDRENAESEVERLGAERSEADEAVGNVREESAAINASLAAAKAADAADSKSLEESRKSDGADAKLEEALALAADGLKEAGDAQAELDKRLKAMNAEAREAERTAANGRVTRLEREIKTAEAELNQIAGRLGRDSEKGLLEGRNRAASLVAHAEREDAVVRRRADAIKLLHEKLLEHRDSARRSVVEPYAQRIERLGKIVFGPDVEFEISADSLQIESRTMDGRTVPFDSLSGGAKEQIGVLSALACAELVAKNDDVRDRGAPIVLDDALGFSDDIRLKRLGAAFSAATADCQVIILTCNRDRYRGIGDAEFVRFESDERVIRDEE